MFFLRAVSVQQCVCSVMSNSVMPLSAGFSRQEYWRGLPFPPPEDLPHTGIEPGSPASALAGGFLTTEPPGKPQELSTKAQQ